MKYEKLAIGYASSCSQSTRLLVSRDDILSERSSIAACTYLLSATVTRPRRLMMDAYDRLTATALEGVIKPMWYGSRRMISAISELRCVNRVTTQSFQPAFLSKTPYLAAQEALNELSALVKVSVDDEPQRPIGTIVALGRSTPGLCSTNVGSLQLLIEPL